MPDWLWEKIEPLLPPPPLHPLGTHRRRIPNRQVMDAILLVLRTGMQWNALRVTGICNSSSAHRRFGGVGASRCLPRDLAPGPAELRRADRHRLVLSLGRWGDEQGAARGAKDRTKPHGSRQKGAKRSLLADAAGIPLGLACDGANRNDHLLLKVTLDSIPVSRPRPTEKAPQGLCLDPATPRAASWLATPDSVPTSAAAARRSRRSSRLRAGKPGAGWWKPATPSLTATAACSSAGRRRPRTTSLCRSWPAA